MLAMFAAALLGVGAGIVIPLVTKAIIDGPVARGERSLLLPLALVAFGLGAVEAILTFVRRWIQSTAVLGMETAIRGDLYRSLQRLPVSFHDRWQSGAAPLARRHRSRSDPAVHRFRPHLPDRERAHLRHGDGQAWVTISEYASASMSWSNFLASVISTTISQPDPYGSELISSGLLSSTSFQPTIVPLTGWRGQRPTWWTRPRRTGLPARDGRAHRWQVDTETTSLSSSWA
jgi:ABC-type multidrug transport system fused ATPase/permease subunit